MEVTAQILTVVSVVLFLYYGLSCLFTDAMTEEFERFGLARFRRFTGILEILGAVGLLIGYALPSVTIIASAGLSLLMVLGVATRIRVRDRFLQIVPALVLMLANAFVLYDALRNAA